MFPLPLMMTLLAGAAPLPAAPPCRASQLRVSVDGRDGEFDGMSHSGVELSIRNTGADCTLPALPVLEFRDARGRLLRVSRQVPLGMHPGPAMVPLRITGGHRVATDLRWVSGPVFTANNSVSVASVVVRIGSAMVRAPLKVVMFGQAGKAVRFEQPPLRAMEGMASG